MLRIGLLSDDPKVGSFAEQRKAMGEVRHEWLPSERSDCIAFGVREGETLVLPHARALGRMRERELILADLAERGVMVEIPGHEPQVYDTPEKMAEFHAEARRPTGRPSRKQKRLMGRPRKYPKPDDDQMRKIIAWFDGPQHMDDVLALIAEMLRKKVPRPTVYEWVGRGRAPHPDRPRRKPKPRKRKEQ